MIIREGGVRNRDYNLGINIGTASNRLRRNIMFNLLMRLNENVCFRCGKPINTPEEFSIDHKSPWRGEDPSLFWDLDNIAFSHLKCNKADRPAMNKESKRRIVGPDGTSWCYQCKEFLPEVEFTKNRNRWNGYSWQCKSCSKLYKSRKREAEQRSATLS